MLCRPLNSVGIKTDSLSLFFTALGGVVILFIMAPLAGMVLKTTPLELADAARDSEVISSVWLTLWTSMVGALFFSLFAVPLAYLLARKKFPGKSLVNGIVDLPVVIPHTSAGIALLGLMSRDSLVGRAGNFLGIDFIGAPPGIILAMSFVSLPFLVNAARDGFLAVPERLEKAALNLGASPFYVFSRVSLPLARRSILTGVILMWARGMSEFGAVVIIAYHPMISPILIFERFGAFGLKYARPIAALFLFISLLAFILLRLLSSGKNNAFR